ncbi:MULTISPECIES: phage terminase small subunit P27 family [Actinomadura]|uniref:Phage terminase small subunit P27 family n=2 Tax=Actinomadura TaxID=1988 RepID=A0A7K1L8X8_9ACTN|nr:MULTISPECIES: phage terminase small subunit P27 family [Actinomadura]KAB2372052.1 phage terminase small subunit P27 family [Actinomadura montaniterrae]MUN40878.1 phage terminase small subunit P27 family [Actinomadura litoris]
MPQRPKSNDQLRLISGKSEAEADRREHARKSLGGAALDWEEVSVIIPEDSYADEEWTRLSEVYANQPDRFREADRGMVTLHCVWTGVYAECLEQINAEGLFVKGISKRDAHRMVRNPATALLNVASNQLRFLAKELGFSPDARKRAGIIEKQEERSSNEDLLSG